MDIKSIQALTDNDMQSVNQLIYTQLQSDVALVNQLGLYIVNSGGKRVRPIIEPRVWATMDELRRIFVTEPPPCSLLAPGRVGFWARVVACASVWRNWSDVDVKRLARRFGGTHLRNGEARPC